MIAANAVLLAVIACTLVLILLAVLFPRVMRVLVGGGLSLAGVGAFWVWSAGIDHVPSSWKEAQEMALPGSTLPGINAHRTTTQADVINGYIARDRAEAEQRRAEEEAARIMGKAN